MPSTNLFNRQWRVTIGKAGDKGRVWTGLRTLFRVWKNGDATPNKMELDISNLSADSRHYIESAGKDWAVILEAGYGQDDKSADFKLLFTGRLELGTSIKRGQHNHHKQGADWVTKIEGRDGVRAYRSIILSKSFGAGVSDRTVLDHIAKAMGVTIGKLDKSFGKTKFNHGRQLSGAAKNEMDNLCRSRGVRWSIQDGVLNILPYGGSVDSTAIVIGPSTGLVGSPERTEKGVKVLTLLRGGVNPGSLIQIDSADLKGNYVAEMIHHRGDSHDLEWYTEIECIKLT